MHRNPNNGQFIPASRALISLLDLDLMIAKAKSSGDQIWYHTKSISVATGTETSQMERHWAVCQGYRKKFADTELSELLALEMFLRAGKRMEHSVKIEHRRRADQLKESILRRKL